MKNTYLNIDLSISNFYRTIEKFNGQLPIYIGISMHFHKEIGEHNEDYNQIENLDYTGWDLLSGIFKQLASLS